LLKAISRAVGGRPPAPHTRTPVCAPLRIQCRKRRRASCINLHPPGRDTATGFPRLRFYRITWKPVQLYWVIVGIRVASTSVLGVAPDHLQPLTLWLVTSGVRSVDSLESGSTQDSDPGHVTPLSGHWRCVVVLSVLRARGCATSSAADGVAEACPSHMQRAASALAPAR